MRKIKLLLFDVDGVITDAKKYIDGHDIELKSISLKDLDTFRMFKDAGYIIGCISGEDNAISRQLGRMQILDFVKIGCKQKADALKEAAGQFRVSFSEICYIGDGKYDIPVLEKVGLALCPNDAIEEVKRVSDIVLKRKGGEGCIAEAYTLFLARDKRMSGGSSECDINPVPVNRMKEHNDVLNAIMKDGKYLSRVGTAANMIIESYIAKGSLLLCGNGGSAADAQHLAAELVGRFYLERKALSAEALTTNTSIITSLANDYDYNMIFARQLEAKAAEGDVLIGLTTSGMSENILQAFKKAKSMKVKTILMTGNISEYAPVLEYTDCLLAVPSGNTPRIQEMHILTGHIICEIVEQQLAAS